MHTTRFDELAFKSRREIRLKNGFQWMRENVFYFAISCFQFLEDGVIGKESDDRCDDELMKWVEVQCPQQVNKRRIQRQGDLLVGFSKLLEIRLLGKEIQKISYCSL